VRLPSRLNLLVCAFAFAIPTMCAATEGVVTHHATLRSDPSSQHRPILVLQSGEDVEVLDPTPTHKYYHVRTADGTEGWVYSRNIEIISTAPAVVGGGTPATPTNVAQPGVSTSLSPNWDKPDPAPNTFEGPDGECGPTGDGGDAFTNLRKNRTDVPQSYHEVTWKSLQSLPYPVAGRSLDQWTSQQKDQIKPYEGVPVSVTGYIIKIKVEDKGSGESTNCHFVNPDEVDWHVPFVEHPGDGEDTAVVVETTPRVRKSHPKWTPTNLSTWVGSQAPVRISGWTLLDPEHRAHLGKYRSTLWEIHPVTKIEVFRNGQWVDVDDLP
jgi:Bacterial SH3 domain